MKGTNVDLQKLNFNKFREIIVEEKNDIEKLTIEEELNLYKNKEFLIKSDNPLDFWKEYQKKFSNLSNIAEMIYFISASNAASERMFSLSGNILGKKKANMKPDTVDAIIKYRKYYLSHLN